MKKDDLLILAVAWIFFGIGVVIITAVDKDIRDQFREFFKDIKALLK